MSVIRFTQLPDRLRYPANIKSKLSTYHIGVVNYVVNHYENRVAFRRRVCQVMNTITYRVVSGDYMPDNWSQDDPLNNLPLEDNDVLKYYLSKLSLYVDESSIEWDVIPADANNHKVVPSFVSLDAKDPPKLVATPKEDLYIQPPLVPRFDYTKPYARVVSGNDMLVIYTSLPEIPTKQNEISVTTDVNNMTAAQLMQLYPNQFIRTRSPVMYNELPGVPFDDQLGLLIPFQGFSEEAIRRNVIEYPHIYQLRRVTPKGIVSFYQSIELNGELHSIYDVWDILPDTQCLPKTAEYIKEYVVRRYLLERDSGVKHNYPMFGSLDRYLTLFTTPAEYAELGVIDDPVELARMCVRSRVSYKQTRNPILRRLGDG